MIVNIDSGSGFCWGVVRTVHIAEETLLAHKGKRDVYVLGHIIHNPKEMQRLAALGLKTIAVADFPTIAHSNAIVLIRAHGEPPATYQAAWENGIELIDATCPVVTKLQERVRKFFDQGYQIIIFGKKDHAEIVGLRGVVGDRCLVVLTPNEAVQVADVTKKTVLFSQTTMDRATFYLIRDALKERISDLLVEPKAEPGAMLQTKDTICGQVSGREENLARFAASNDVMLFVAGKASSNGKVLFEVSRSANPATHFIEEIDEIQPEWFTNVNTVGISGATSTPQWYMEEVRDWLLSHYGT
ncbi:MAG: 4-hydroxy-3-methylbut-2-enyl diphosphate reductase [Chlorobi bacterium]|nr:MAG: 4-hydroxy-3-methylbut-2-enyl diphosphate reductase [Bacteroidota bacterium]KXK35371.1 MAG: hydroxymethylbutenyl pyrophosphate reductase [Chlorobi bacterium OLB6]MBE2265557.1 4-hydroxy-3-methylbut-2-enyl diphosphate reductase [Flavobacteriales bacterium]MBL1160725.1 4-hydroxy-3-methylbut-2-enyl diphosphate reductase [Chlorobiota bacterium]MBW7853076.1 4-hydroxy-3-methylbut-2-enyl diphosphate reductase [Candidatus Kapabacteria bacterium]MCC6331435.1 4-hydroxy-3-methylbut-2-enyl diphospha